MIGSFITTITAVSCLLVILSSVNSVELNKPAPDFTLTDINDKEHKLSDYRDKVILIAWSSIKTKDDNKKFTEDIYIKFTDEDFSGKGTLVYISVFDFVDKPFYVPMSLIKKRIRNRWPKGCANTCSSLIIRGSSESSTITPRRGISTSTS